MSKYILLKVLVVVYTNLNGEISEIAVQRYFILTVVSLSFEAQVTKDFAYCVSL